MAPRGTPRVRIAAVGRAAAAALPFRAGERLRVAAIVKATFVMAQDGPMLHVAAEPIVARDRHHGDDPKRSLCAASDLVPYRPRTDVLLAGNARAPVSAPAVRVGLRVMLARGQQMLLDKRLMAQGPPGPDGAPTPFATLPLVYENTARAESNPVGVPEGTPPGIVDSWYRPVPVGFGPIDPRWPQRLRLLRDPDAVRAPLPSFPVDFAWAYFNAAPEDQRVSFLQGDEWVGFEGMNAQIPRVQSYLPGVRGVARLYGPEPGLAAGRPIDLAADTLTIDADGLRVSVVWRGSFAVASASALATLCVVAGVETADEPLALPASYEAALAPPPAPPSQDDIVDTLDLPADVAQEARGRPAVPFPPQAPLPPRAPPSRPLPRATPFDQIPAATVQRAGTPTPPPPPGGDARVTSTTLDIPPEIAAKVRAAAGIPFVPTAQPPRTPPSRPLPRATPFDLIPATTVQPSPTPATATPSYRAPVDETLPAAEPLRTSPVDLPPADEMETTPVTLPPDLAAVVRAKAGLPFAPTAPLPPRPPSERPLPPATPFERIAAQYARSAKHGGGDGGGASLGAFFLAAIAREESAHR